MDDSLGFNAHKLQSVVRKSIKLQQERSSFRSGYKNSITSQSMTGTIIVNTDQQQLTLAQIPYPNQIDEENESPSNRKKLGNIQFQFVVSSSSSDDSLSLSPVQNYETAQKQTFQNKIVQQEKHKVEEEDQAKAISTLKTMMRRRPDNEQKIKETNDKFLSNNNSSMNIHPQKPMEDSVRERSDKQSQEKRQINFLKGLNQNQGLTDNASIEEYYQDGKIIVNMHSRDLLTFVRLQHEVDELKRKQDDFNVQKERHFNLAKKENELSQQKQLEKNDSKKNHDAWWVGIALAKRFLRKARKSQSQARMSNMAQKGA